VRLYIQHWPAPTNDRFEDALLISDGIDPTVGPELQQARRDLFEPNHGGLPAYSSVWWRWVAPRAGRVLVRTRQSPGFPLALAVYQGTTIPSLELVAERAFDGMGGVLEFEATAGTEYRLALASTGPYAGVGTRLEIVGPETVSPIRWLTIERVGEQIRLRYSAPVGRRLRLDQSTDLLKWTQRDLLEVVAEEGELTLKPEELGAGQFFRFVSPDGGG
jgi:hypothetical protein